MTNDINTQLLTALNRQQQLLEMILSSLDKPKLGLHNDAGICKIYCNRHNGCNWYTLTNGEPTPVQATALTGYLKAIKFEATERRGKPVHKLLTTIAADRLYILESGHDSHFSKGLLAAIAQLRPQDLLQPVTIQPSPGDEDSVLFCRVWLGVEQVRAQYNEETDWREVAKQAIAVVRALEIPTE